MNNASIKYIIITDNISDIEYTIQNSVFYKKDTHHIFYYNVDKTAFNEVKDALGTLGTGMIKIHKISDIKAQKPYIKEVIKHISPHLSNNDIITFINSNTSIIGDNKTKLKGNYKYEFSYRVGDVEGRYLNCLAGITTSKDYLLSIKDNYELIYGINNIVDGTALYKDIFERLPNTKNIFKEIEK